MNWPLLQNSLLVAAATTVFAAVLGVTAALALAGSGKSIRHGALALAAVALALPPFLVTNCWLDLLGGHGAWRVASAEYFLHRRRGLDSDAAHLAVFIRRAGGVAAAGAGPA